MSNCDETVQRYIQTFDRAPPMPFGVGDQRLAEVLGAALREGRPVPADFDWWADLPPDAVA